MTRRPAETNSLPRVDPHAEVAAGAIPDPWACPGCRSGLTGGSGGAGLFWECRSCGLAYPVTSGLPRFVQQGAYARSFELEWTAFQRTQHDSYTKTTHFRDRFESTTGWTLSSLTGRRVLEVGCGAGPFQEIVANSGAESFGIDLSGAIDACNRNHGSRENVHLAQADAFHPPFRDRSFDCVFSIGVLHHTPDPRAAFLSIARLARPGGRVAIWVYHRLPLGAIRPADLIRLLLTSHLPPRVVLGTLRAAVPPAVALRRLLGRVPLAGKYLRKAIPVADYRDSLTLPRYQLREWELLDTFDMLTPRHVKPQSPDAVLGWFKEAGLVRIRRTSPVPIGGGVGACGEAP